MSFILAIESSCDDTSAAVLENDKVLSNKIANQDVHKQYGGVVPELASRAHLQNIIPVVDAALKEAGIQKERLSAVAFTRGPGLLGSLLVGVSFAKSFAWSLNLPIIEIHHLEAHILSHFIKETPDKEVPEFPFLCLLVSGGHTQIMQVNSDKDMKIIGQTIDDAAGEAFDKAAKIMGLPYPGGVMIDKLAKEGNPLAFTFAEPKIPNLDFSFSGLKTSFLYFLRDRLKEDPDFIEKHKVDLCASIQHSIVQILLKKLKKAIQQTNIKTIAIAGGVSANSALRQSVTELGEKMGVKVFIPKFEFCTDNAAMVGIAGYFKFQRKDFSSLGIAPFLQQQNQ